MGPPFILLYGGFALCILSVSVHSYQDWEYVLLRIETNTSNPDIVSLNLRPIRVNRGVYAVNGSIFCGQDFDNTYSVEFKLYRSASGSSDFKATPFQFAATTFYNFMNKIYIKMLQKDLAKCTNLPVYKDTFEGPFPKGLYTFNRCTISTEAMPGHGQPGLYRATSRSWGKEGEVWTSVFFEVNSKLKLN